MWLRLPEVPLTLTVNVPVGAEGPADRVRVLLAVVGLGMKDAMTPLGRPEAARFTAALKPFNVLTVIVLVAPVP